MVGAMGKLLRAPALHFVVIGGLLFNFGPSSDTPEQGHAAAIREPIVITGARRAQIRDLYTRETGLGVTQADEKALLEREIREELLYREALAHNLHLHDRSIQWRLVSKMTFLAEAGEAADGDADSHRAGSSEELYREALALGLDRDDVVVKRILIHKMRLLIRLQADDDVPDEAELRAFFDEHADDYMQPPRATFTHVFTSRDRHGRDTAARAQTRLAELRTRAVSPGDAVAHGDPFPLGHTYRSRSRAGVAKIFGDTFAGAVIDAEPDRWSGPIESAYGWHAVWVQDRQGERLPEFTDVRSQVFQRYVNERRTAHLERTLTRLRDEYEIVIEDAPQEEGT